MTNKQDLRRNSSKEIEGIIKENYFNKTKDENEN